MNMRTWHGIALQEPSRRLWKKLKVSSRNELCKLMPVQGRYEKKKKNKNLLETKRHCPHLNCACFPHGHIYNVLIYEPGTFQNPTLSLPAAPMAERISCYLHVAYSSRGSSLHLPTVIKANSEFWNTFSWLQSNIARQVIWPSFPEEINWEKIFRRAVQTVVFNYLHLHICKRIFWETKRGELYLNL